MIRSMLARNLRHHARLLLALGSGLAAVELLLVWIMAQIDMGPGLMTLMEMFLPPELNQLIASQALMTSFAGGVGFGFQHPFVLVCTLAFVIVAATLFAGERESGLLDLLLARPVARASYVLAGLLLLLLGAALLPLAVLAGAALGLLLVQVPDELPWTRYLPSAAALTTLMLAVGGYTAFIASGVKRRGTAIAWATGLTVALFLLNFLATLWSPLRSLSWISPFHYFDPIAAAVVPRTPVANPVVLITVFVVGSVAGLLRFQKQDI